MAHIRTTPPEEATGELKQHYDAGLARAGRVFKIVQLQSLNPAALGASIALYETLMIKPGPLPRATREMLAVIVAKELDCFYCMEAHGEDLRKVTHDDELAKQIKRDFRQAWLDPKRRALLDYAVQLTRDPRKVTRDTIENLQELGWSDEDILTATHIIGFFNYYARLADALGVEPEDFMGRP